MKEIIDRKFRILAVNPCTHKIYTERNSVLFVAKDKALPAALSAYRDECVRIKANPEHIKSVDLLIERVATFQKDVEVRIPDTVGNCEIGRCIGGIIEDGE